VLLTDVLIDEKDSAHGVIKDYASGVGSVMEHGFGSSMGVRRLTQRDLNLPAPVVALLRCVARSPPWNRMSRPRRRQHARLRFAEAFYELAEFDLARDPVRSLDNGPTSSCSTDPPMVVRGNPGSVVSRRCG